MASRGLDQRGSLHKERVPVPAKLEDVVSLFSALKAWSRKKSLLLCATLNEKKEIGVNNSFPPVQGYNSVLGRRDNS
jgi:hypothetical protein